jgi:hypothetical protein
MTQDNNVIQIIRPAAPDDSQVSLKLTRRIAVLLLAKQMRELRGETDGAMQAELLKWGWTAEHFADFGREAFAASKRER